MCGSNFGGLRLKKGCRLAMWEKKEFMGRLRGWLEGTTIKVFGLVYPSLWGGCLEIGRGTVCQADKAREKRLVDGPVIRLEGEKTWVEDDSGLAEKWALVGMV